MSAERTGDSPHFYGVNSENDGSLTLGRRLFTPSFLKQSLEALMLGAGNVELPDTQDADEKELKTQIELAINQGKPSIALDRLHTLATKVLKSVCASNGIALQNAKKERYNVAQLVGMLWKKCGLGKKDWETSFIETFSSHQ